MTAARRVDAHVHFWKLARGDYGWITPEVAPLMRDFGPDDLRPHLAAAGIDAVVLVQAAPTAAETRFLFDIAAAEPLVAGVVGWTDMAAADAIAALAENPRLRGVRPMIQDIADVDWMLRDELAPAFRAVAETGICFDALVKPPHLRNLRRLLERHPDLKTV
ncbi:MAG: amidohydrolase family protein, partial [Dongiaceae bacterium]